LLRHTIETAESVSPGEIIVVTGSHDSEIRRVIDGGRAHWIFNRQWQKGMGGSIAAGAAAINSRSEAVMILLCDQWRINQHDLENLIDAWQANKETIVTAYSDRQMMPPVIFPACYFSELRKLSGDTGARSLLQKQPGRVKAIPLGNASFDLDDPEQLAALKREP
jgi:molybdenum cofactor cytidylyltransferase